MYQQDGPHLGVWWKQTLSHPSHWMKITSPSPSPQVLWFEKLCFSLVEVSSDTFFSGEKFLSESKANDIKGAGSESLQQFGLLFFTLETSMSTGQTEPRRPKYAAQNSVTSCTNLKGGSTWGALSMSSYWTPASWQPLSLLSLLGARKWGGSQISSLQNIINPCPRDWPSVTSTRPKLGGWGLFWNALGPRPWRQMSKVQRTLLLYSEPSLWESAWCPQRQLHTRHSADRGR